MEFKSLKNIESNFRLIRICCALFAGLCTAVAVASVGFSYAFAERQRQKIYVLDGGRSLMVALSQDLSQNRPVEAREHVRRFHELFFTLSPDKAAIESNLNRALLMADRSALSYYKALSEKGFFNRLIDLRPAAHHAREHHHRAVARNDLPPHQRRALGQQPPGVSAGESERHRKQGPRNL